MTPTAVMEVPGKRWPQEQCATCKMVFTLSPLDEASGVKAKGMLLEELDRHIQQSHIDVPSDWRAGDHS
jgi:hypothetical protein